MDWTPVVWLVFVGGSCCVTWLWNKCAFVGDSRHRWVSRAEWRIIRPPLMSLQASDAKSCSWEAPCLMHYMQAHNCKLHYNDCTAFAKHRCQSKYFWNTEAMVVHWFSVICGNKHFNQSILESYFFFSPSGRPWLRQKKNSVKGHLFLV